MTRKPAKDVNMKIFVVRKDMKHNVSIAGIVSEILTIT